MKKQFRSTTWADPRLIKRQSPINGTGIFTTANIKKSEILMIFGGIVVDKNLLDETKHRYQSAFPISINTVLVSPITNIEYTIDEYLNHSCNPSAWLTDEVTVVARRDIKKGQEITVDVATWDIDDSDLYSENGRCYCGEKQCRKFLKTTDYRSSLLQKRYNGHFAPFVQKMIEEEQKTNATVDSLRKNTD